MSDKPCSKCGLRPRIPRNAVCRDCLNAAMRERYHAERAGLRPTGMCPCGQAQRAPGKSYCAECTTKRSRLRYRKLKGLSGEGKPREKKPRVRAGLKYCIGCGRVLALELFGIHDRSADGRKPRCKMCMAEYCREQRRKNSTHYRATRRRYYKEHREKVLTRNRRYKAQRRLAKLKNKAKELGI